MHSIFLKTQVTAQVLQDGAQNTPQKSPHIGAQAFTSTHGSRSVGWSSESQYTTAEASQTTLTAPHRRKIVQYTSATLFLS